MIFGTYYSVSKKHLQRYIDEYVSDLTLGSIRTFKE